MFLRQIIDPSLAQHAYLIGCPRSGEAILIDPERDLDRYFRLAAENDLRIVAVADTHIHADYLSGARELMERHGALAYLSAEGGPDWQFEWAKQHAHARWLRDGDRFRVGNVEFHARLTPGHTPEHLSFLVSDAGADEPMAVLSGDFLFVGDVGRPDLLESAAGQVGEMEPAARALFASLRATASWPDHLQLLPGHGAGSACGKALGAVPTSVLGYERKFNPALRQAMAGNEAAFVHDILAGQPEPPLYFARMKRDNRRGPTLLAAGHLPTPNRLPIAALNQWIGCRGCAMLDLRTDADAFLQQHVVGALFTPLRGGQLPVAAGSYVKEDERILLLLEHEGQLDEVVRQLIRIGLDRVEAWLPVADALEAGATGSLPRIHATALPKGVCVLDVRYADEHADERVRGARHIAHTRLAERLADVPADAALYVHCASGERAAIASAFLAREGREVVVVQGGLDDVPEVRKT